VPAVAVSSAASAAAVKYAVFMFPPDGKT